MTSLVSCARASSISAAIRSSASRFICAACALGVLEDALLVGLGVGADAVDELLDLGVDVLDARLVLGELLLRLLAQLRGLVERGLDLIVALRGDFWPAGAPYLTRMTRRMPKLSSMKTKGGDIGSSSSFSPFSFLTSLPSCRASGRRRTCRRTRPCRVVKSD